MIAINFNMKYLFLKILCCCIFLLGCRQKEEPQLNSSIQLVTLYQVLDEHISPQHVKCSYEDPKKIVEMDKYACSFKLGDYEFDLEEKLIFDASGNLEEYWTYKSEGPLTYSRQDLESDPKFLDHIGGMNLNVKFDSKEKVILLNHKKLIIEKVFPNQKILLIKFDEKVIKKGRRILLEYQEI